MKIRSGKVFALEKILLCIFIIPSSMQSHASMKIYSNESTFLSAAPIDSTEDFERFPDGDYRFGSSTIGVDGVIYSDTKGGDWSVSGAWGGISNSRSLGSTFGEHNEITFVTGACVKAFGFYFISKLGAQYPWEIEVFEKGGSSTLVEVQFTLNEREKYYGFLSDIGIERIIVRDYSGDCCGTNWDYDNVSRSSFVPKSGKLSPSSPSGVGITDGSNDLPTPSGFKITN